MQGWCILQGATILLLAILFSVSQFALVLFLFVQDTQWSDFPILPKNDDAFLASQSRARTVGGIAHTYLLQAGVSNHC